MEMMQLDTMMKVMNTRINFPDEQMNLHEHIETPFESDKDVMKPQFLI